MSVFTRADWGAGQQRAGVIRTPVRELWFHHAVTPFWIGAQAARRLQQIARARGFLDVSYNWLTDRIGNEIEGRGWGRQGAHTAGRNSISHAICLVGNLEDHPLPDGMVRGAVRLVRRHRRYGPGRITGPHSAAPGASTACPGRYARAAIPTINTAATGTPTPPPRGDTMAELTAEQVHLLILNGIREALLPGGHAHDTFVEAVSKADVGVRGFTAEGGQRQIDWLVQNAIRQAIAPGGHASGALEDAVNRILDQRAGSP